MTVLVTELANNDKKVGEKRVLGVTNAQVVNNVDTTKQGRVQIKLPWLPGIEPWARVVALFSGNDVGAYFVPQIDDEVLVAFNHGDVSDPYILGSLWNGRDRPPVNTASDANNKRILRTPSGHEIEFQEVEPRITIRAASQQKITMDASGIKLAGAEKSAKVVLGNDGAVSIEAATSIELKAPNVSIRAQVLELKGTANATLDGGAACTIQGSMVRIN